VSPPSHSLVAIAIFVVFDRTIYSRDADACSLDPSWL
jgi:hypothetical protein